MSDERARRRREAAQAECVRACVASAKTLGRVDDPVEAVVGPLCERLGYGAVITAAARLWMRKDPVGSFVVGPCRIFAVEADEADDDGPCNCDECTAARNVVI